MARCMSFVSSERAFGSSCRLSLLMATSEHNTRISRRKRHRPRVAILRWGAPGRGELAGKYEPCPLAEFVGSASLLPTAASGKMRIMARLSSSKDVVAVAFDDFQMLDVTGPLEVFS